MGRHRLDVKRHRAPIYAVAACVILHPVLFTQAQTSEGDGDGDEEASSEVEIGIEGGGGTYGWSGACTSGTVSYGGLAGTVRYRHTSGASAMVIGGGGVRTSNEVDWTPTWGVGALGGYRGRFVGLEGGLLVFSTGMAGQGIDGLPAFRLRVGRLDSYHFRAGFADRVPVQRGSFWVENAVGGLGPMTIAAGVSMMPQLSVVEDSGDESGSISPYFRIEGALAERYFLGGSFYLSLTNGVYPQGFWTFGVRL